MNTILIIYWIATTIIGVIWIAKHPSSRRGDEEYVTLLEIIAMIFPAAIVSWVMVPMMLLNEIKFKRK
jgi:heme/copper-type cytochrome/quinol oxidase subunit 2